MKPKDRQNPESVVREIRRKTRWKFSTEEKIRIVLEGLKGEESIAVLCRREGIMLCKKKKLQFTSKFLTPNVDGIPVAPVGTVSIPKD